MFVGNVWQKSNVKGRVVSVDAMKAYWGSRGIAPVIPNHDS